MGDGVHEFRVFDNYVEADDFILQVTVDGVYCGIPVKKAVMWEM